MRKTIVFFLLPIRPTDLGQVKTGFNCVLKEGKKSVFNWLCAAFFYSKGKLSSNTSTSADKKRDLKTHNCCFKEGGKGT